MNVRVLAPARSVATPAKAGFGSADLRCRAYASSGIPAARRLVAALAVAAAVAASAGAIHVAQTDRSTAGIASAPAAKPPAEVAPVAALESRDALPLVFSPNVGQAAPGVAYHAQVPNASFSFARDHALFAFARGTKGMAVQLTFPGASPDVQLDAGQPSGGRANYLLGDRATWRTGVPTHDEVVYRGLWPGIDLAFSGAPGKLKYEFRVAPGADASAIAVAYRGPDRLSLARGGDLMIHTPLGVLRDTAPVTYQVAGGKRVPVASRYVLDGNRYGFALGAYDASRPLVIDPGIVYSTYLGGSAEDIGHSIAVDAAGNAHVTGQTSSTNFPTTPGAFDTSHDGGADVFVTKLDPTGQTLLYSTYLGGGGTDIGYGVAVDLAGNAHITGTTQSDTFPTTVGAFDRNRNGADAFVTKLSTAGTPIYSTFLGGNGDEIGWGIDVDPAGNAHVTGQTSSNNFPTTLGAFDTSANGGIDAFVTKLNPLGTAPLVYSTHLGGSSEDIGRAIAVDVAGNAHVAGQTSSTNFPTTVGAFDRTHNGGIDAFAAKLATTGNALVYSTFLGGSAQDIGYGIAVDAAGNAHVTGETFSSNYPTTPTAYDPTYNGSGDAFVTKLTTTGNAPIYSTFLGGSQYDVGYDVEGDAAGTAHVTGETRSSNFPTTAGAHDTGLSGSSDAFVTKLNTAGTAPLLYSTYLGGSNEDYGRGIDVDAATAVYVTGHTRSSDFPTGPLGFDQIYNGGGDAFVTKLLTAIVPTRMTLSPEADTNPAGTQHCVTARVTDDAGNPASGIRVRFTVTGANPTTGTATTNASGEAVFCYTGTTAGPDAITAFADTDADGTRDANEPAAAATKVWTPAAPSTMTLTPVADENPTGEQHCFTATVRDAFGNPVAGVPVRFSVSGANTAGGTVTTNADGRATFCYTGTRVGVDTVRAYADTDGDNVQDTGEPFAVATKTYQPGDPAAVVVEPPADENPVGTQHCVTATVTDMFGNRVAGETVVFEVTGANPQPAATRTTDAAGVARFCYTGTTAGLDTIEAFVDTNGNGDWDAVGEPTGFATKTWTPGAAFAVIVTPATDTNVVGDQHCVTARVIDMFENPVPGETVYFLVSGANSASGSDTTDASGNAEFCYTGTSAGEDTIFAVADTNDSGAADFDEPTGAATKTWTPGDPAIVVLSPAADENTVGEEHCVTATVTDTFGNPVPDADVVFEVRGANPQARETVATNDDGEATFCYTGTIAGLDTIEAFADTNENGDRNAGEPVGTATKLYQPGAAATVTLDPAADENPVGTQHCVTATVRDAFGNAVADADVVFRVDGANPRPDTTRTTDEGGQAEFCYTATRSGLDTITAYADSDESGTPDPGEPDAAATKLWGPGDPATVEVSPATATNTAGDEHCVTATVRDEFGNTVGAGVAVEFTVAGANSVGATVVETDANGQAEFCYTGTTAGTDTIRAIADANDDGRGDEVEPMGVATKVYGPAEAATVTLDPPAATNTAGDEHCVTATVRDAFGNPVDAGVEVLFTVNGANEAAGVDATDDNGEAVFCYTGTVAGVDAITATADADDDGQFEATEPTGAAEKTYGPAAPATVEVSPATAENRAGERHCVVATVRDAFGNRVPGVRVEFDVTGANDRDTVFRTTDADGEAEFCYTGTVAGVDAIRVTADADGDGAAEPGEPTGTATKLYRPGRPAAVILTPAAATNEVGDTHCVTASVRDEFGNPVEAGVQVEFDVTGVNPRMPVQHATDADGEATFCYRGTAAGVDAIRATADADGDGEPQPGDPTNVAAKTWRPGNPASVELSPRAAENTAGEQHCVTATVRDEFGNPVEAGVQVEFDVNGVNDRPPARRATNASGQAEFCYTGTVAGPDTIRATADGDEDGQPEPGEPTDVATKLYHPGQPATVELDPPTAVNRAGDEHCVVATVRDAFGNLVPGVRVEFDVSGSNDQPPALRTTDQDGRATFCYRGTVAGADTIRATADADGDRQPEVGEPTTVAEKTWRPGRPFAVELEPVAAENEVGEEHCVTATVRDEFGNPVEAGVRVEFDVSGANDRAPATRTTDANGEAEFCYTGTVAGVDAIRATADGDEDGQVEPAEPTNVAEKTYRPGAPATVEVTPVTDVNRAGEEHCVTATVRDEFGNPVDAGVAVEFDVTGANDRPAARRTTDRNGQASFCYTGTVAGEDVIRATADGDGDGTPEAGEPTGAGTKTYRPGAPVAVTVTPATDVNRAGERHCVVATVRDEFGNPVDESVGVLFTVTGANNRAQTRVATGNDGRAEFCYTGTVVGEDLIRATADTDGDGTADPGEPTNTAAKTYRPGAPFSVTVSPAAATNVAGTEHCVTATVRDEFGNAVEAGVSVQFNVTGANTAGPTVQTTDTSGQARFCYTGTVAGEDVVRAVADANDDGTFALTEPTGVAEKTYRPGVTTSVTVTPTTAVNTAGEEHCVTATTRDEFVNPTPGIAVQFTVTGANNRGPTVRTTDANGQATFCYTGTVAGEDVIRAVADANDDGTFAPTEPTGGATKTYEPGQPATLELSPKTAVNTVDDTHCVTATVRDEFGNPVPGVTVRFDVTGTMTEANGPRTTNRDGEAEFCYQGPPLPGADVITAYADLDSDETQDPAEPFDTASKVWVVPQSTELCEVNITNGGWIVASNGDRAGFGGNAKADAEANVSGHETYTDHGPVEPLKVQSTEILAVTCNEDRTEGTIYGTAEINGTGEHNFRIRVRDSGEPSGGGDMYGILLDTGYYSGEQPLQGGNVQIH